MRGTFRVAALAAGTTLATAACGGADTPAAPQSIGLDLSGPRPTVALRLENGASGVAIFDSGAAASVVKLDFARRADVPELGPANAAGPGGRPIAGYRTEIKGVLGGAASFGPTLAVALDIPLPLPGVDAVISPSVFAGRLVRFDFAHAMVQVLPDGASSRPPGPGYAYRGANGPSVAASTPAAPVQLPDGETVSADLDTGFPGGLELPLDIARRLPLREALAPMAAAQTIGAERPRFHGRIAGVVRIGPLVLTDPEITAVDGAPTAKLGMAVLRPVVIVLSPADGRDWLLTPPRDH
jgi:hypothetical protein